jgi:hypothetical protein
MTSLKTFGRNDEFKDRQRATSNGRPAFRTHQSNWHEQACEENCSFAIAQSSKFDNFKDGLAFQITELRDCKITKCLSPSG